MPTNIIVRKACAADCARMMELVNELAVYERAPHEVTVSMEHFIESGCSVRLMILKFISKRYHLLYQVVASLGREFLTGSVSHAHWQINRGYRVVASILIKVLCVYAYGILIACTIKGI